MKAAVVIPMRDALTEDRRSQQEAGRRVGELASRPAARRWTLAVLRSRDRLRPGRQLHVLDVENLLCGTRFTVDDLARLRATYATATDMAPDAHVVIGASANASALTAGMGWTGARIRLRHGRDGADLALAEVLEHENVPARFCEVFIGSGDGIFAPLAAQLARQGVTVTVVARRDALAKTLCLAAGRVIHVDDDTLALAPPAPSGATGGA